MNNPAKNLKLINLRAKLPVALRVVSLLALAGALIFIVVVFLLPAKPTFKMIPGLAELSKDVVATVNGYERRQTEGEKTEYYVKADKMTVFKDNHQEWDNVYFEVYDKEGAKFDKISAIKAVYIPNDGKNFTVHLLGGVSLISKDAVTLKSEQVSYQRETETAQTDQPLEFSYHNIAGKAVGANYKVKEKKIELASAVEINTTPAQSGQTDALKGRAQSAQLKAGSAVFDQGQGFIELHQNFWAHIVPVRQNSGTAEQPVELQAQDAKAILVNDEIKQIDLSGAVEIFQKPTGGNPKSVKTRSNFSTAYFDKQLTAADLRENVEIEAVDERSKLSNIRAQLANYDAAADKFDLQNSVEIINGANEPQPLVIHSGRAIYEQTSGKLNLGGNADIAQGGDYLKANEINANLFQNKKIANAVARGAAYLKRQQPDRLTEVSAGELNANWSENNLLQKASAIESVQTTITPAQAVDYSKITVNAPRSATLDFQQSGDQSFLNQIQTDGRTAILMSAPAGKADSTNRKLTADNVKTFFAPNGKDLNKAEAVGNAELYVEPTQASADKFKTMITAPRFDCDFYEGNNAKSCLAQIKAKAVSEPMIPAANRGTRTLTSDKMTAQFSRANNNIEVFEAVDNAKFNELDRNGAASRIAYTAADETVRLRGGEPTVWDSRFRARGGEIDWNTKYQKSYLRNKVSTTYYAQKLSGGATPFSNSNSPVYLTSNEAEFDHAARVGVYTGNARAWQDNNYVRAERMILQEQNRRMDAEGKVQSLLYNVKQSSGGKSVNQPASAASDKMIYQDQNKTLRYESNVDIRQGSDRITSGVAEIYLDENNQAKQFIVEKAVVITQPNRRATGTWAQYTVSDEVMILRGNPATVADAEQGASQGSQMTVSMRDNRVTNQGSTKPSQPGRIRSVYKTKP